MSDFPESVARLAEDPKFVGKCGYESGAGIAASFVCGTGIRFSVSIDPNTRSIVDARYQTNGCAFMIASAEIIAREGIGRKLTDLRGTRSLESTIGQSVTTQQRRQHCSEIALEAFRSALSDHRDRVIEELRGEKALICTCFGVAEDTIVSLIEKGASEVSDVSAACNAGLGCGSCQMLIRELIEAHEDEPAENIML
jgi:NifU-like protein